MQPYIKEITLKHSSFYHLFLKRAYCGKRREIYNIHFFFQGAAEAGLVCDGGWGRSWGWPWQDSVLTQHSTVPQGLKQTKPWTNKAMCCRAKCIQGWIKSRDHSGSPGILGLCQPETAGDRAKNKCSNHLNQETGQQLRAQVGVLEPMSSRIEGSVIINAHRHQNEHQSKMQSWVVWWRGPVVSDSCWAKWLLLKYCSRLNVSPTLCGKFVWDILDWWTCCVWQGRSLKRASMLNVQNESTSPVVEVLEIDFPFLEPISTGMEKV